MVIVILTCILICALIALNFYTLYIIHHYVVAGLRHATPRTITTTTDNRSSWNWRAPTPQFNDNNGGWPTANDNNGGWGNPPEYD